MTKFLIIIIVSLSGFTQTLTESHIKKLESLKEVSAIDLIHEHPGCPENSKCSKQNGYKRRLWHKSLKKYDKTKNTAQLNKFIKEYGHPTVFLIDEDKSKSLDPIIFSSRCEFHKKKNIVEGTLFLKRKPTSEDIVFNKITVNNKSYTIPYNTRILGFKNNRPIIIFDENDVFYTVTVSDKLEFKVIKLTDNELDKLLSNKESSVCKQKPKKDLYYKTNECYKVYDLTLKSQVKVNQRWSCL